MKSIKISDETHEKLFEYKRRWKEKNISKTIDYIIMMYETYRGD